jgi:penicillin-binding protein 2
MVARLVNGGKAIAPHVVRKSPLPLGEGAFNPAHLALIRKGMEGVVNAPGGTARHLASYNLKIAGKTGTAQTVGYESKVQKGDHAWFVGYAPYDDPQIVVAAIVEHAGHGGTAAAPIVGEVIKAYLGEGAAHHVTP